LATARPREATASGNDNGDNGEGVTGPVAADVDDDDEVTRLGTADEDAAIKAGGHLDSARQSAASAVRSATVEVAAAVAPCEAAGDTGPVANLLAASALLVKLLASKPVHVRGTGPPASAAMDDATLASTAVLQAVATVTVPPPRPPAPDESDEGTAAPPADADTRADAFAWVACRRLYARARHAAGSVWLAVTCLIPVVQPDAGDHAGNDGGGDPGGDAGATARSGGGTRGHQRRCGGCGATGHNVQMCQADAVTKAAHAARGEAAKKAKGVKAGSGNKKCSACHARGHTRASAVCPMRAISHGWSSHNGDRGRDLGCADQHRMTGEVTTTASVSVDRFFGVERRLAPGWPADSLPPTGRPPTTSSLRAPTVTAAAVANAAAGAAALTKLATAQTKHPRLVSIVMDGTMRYLVERVDGGGTGAGGGGGGRSTLHEFMAAVPASLMGSHGPAWKQVASNVSCRGVHAFGGAPRRACVCCSGRVAHFKPRGDIKAAAQDDGDYSAFVAASAAVADAVTEPNQLPCSTLLQSPGDTSGWATVAMAFENYYVTHVTSVVKAIAKCIVHDVYPQAPGEHDGQRRVELIAALVAGLQAADGTRPPSFKWPAVKVSTADAASMAAGATLAYDTVLVYAGGDGRRRSLLQLNT